MTDTRNPPNIPLSGVPGGESMRPRRLKVLGREFQLPQSRKARISIGSGMVAFGCFGFLPVLGFWMIPVGLLILSIDFALVRRWRRRAAVYYSNSFTERSRRRNGNRNDSSSSG